MVCVVVLRVDVDVDVRMLECTLFVGRKIRFVITTGKTPKRGNHTHTHTLLVHPKQANSFHDWQYPNPGTVGNKVSSAYQALKKPMAVVADIEP